jgi:hypothetical protein
VKIADDSATRSSAVRSASIPVSAGETYEASVWSYNLQGVSQLYLEYWDAAGDYTAIYIGTNSSLNSWGRITVSGVAPEGTVAATLRLYLHLANVGTAYFDDASFEQLLTGPQPSLLNGDMELVHDGRPKYWTLAATAELSTEQKRSGSYSIKVDDPFDNRGVTVRSHQIQAEPGKKYASSVWSYNLQGVSELYLEFWDASNNYTTILTGRNSTLNQWSQIQVSGIAPEGTAYVTVRFYLHNANVGSAYFDDAEFRELPPDPVSDLANGSFERVKDGKPADWFEQAGTAELSGEQARDGANSAKLAHSGGGSAPELLSLPVIVKPGIHYDASVYAYAAQATPVLRLKYYDSTGVQVGEFAAQGAAAGSVWERLEAGGAAPEGAAVARLSLTLDPSQAGAVYFDDAALRMAGPVAYNKTRTTYYTPEKVAAARENVQTYSWAQSTRDAVVARAETYLAKGLDFLWESVPGPNLPRSYGVNQVLGSPITGRDIDQYGNYPYQADPLNVPWKIVDPSSGYVFPTNDFGAYYRSGLDEHGIFRPELADRSLLVNTLYPERGPDWGVDDGFGWVDENGNRYTFIAYYTHWFLWYGGSSVIQTAIQTLRDAYLYTGDIRFARAGIVLLDRIADVYPEMDTMMHDRTIYLNSHGGTGHGKAVGSIWETGLVKDFISAYDAFYPAMDDPEVVQYLSAKADEFRLTNGKTSGAHIRRNIEDGILREVYPGVKTAKIRGNNGMHQSALAMAAVVLDSMPETGEWLDFVFQSGGNTSSPPGVTGGNILDTLISVVDRDGAGNEAAPGYNTLWLSQMQLTADILEGYDLYPEADLYQNVKFRKMYSAFYPLILSEKYTANIGDSGYTGNPGIVGVRLADMVKAFDKFGDPIFAQVAYFLNNNSADGIHMDIFTRNPGEIAERIRIAVNEHGPLNLDSINMTGYGFAALRDGKNVLQSFGLSYDFPSMEIAHQTVPERWFENNGTIQLEANEPGAAITFNFHVAKTDDYEIDLLPWKAPSYGKYRVLIDGRPIREFDFYGGNNDKFEVLGRLVLTEGMHQITFENIGKHPSSTNYKMGVRKLNLLDERARNARDEAGDHGNTLRDVWMYYGRNTGHGHRDTLNIGMHAFGLDLTPDLGYPEFADSVDMHRAQWVINTVSHNTVVVDKRKQGTQWVADPKHFDDSGIVQLMDVEAPDVYPQTDLYKRTTAMIRIDDANSYAVDFFRIKGGSDHHFSFHGAEGTVTTEGLNMVVQPTGTYAGPDVEYGERVDDVPGSGYMGHGFHYLKNVSRDANPPAQFSIDWDITDTWRALTEPADIHLRLTMLGPVDEVALADGIPPQNKPGNPKSLRYMIAHRTGTNLDSVFTSVIEPYKDSRTIASIEAVEVTAGGAPINSNDVKAVKVTLANGRVDYIVNSLDTNTVYTVDNKLQFKGFMGVYSEKDGQFVYRYVHDGAYIAPLGEAVADAAGSLAGTVVDFTRTPSIRNEITVDLNLQGLGAEDLAGKTIYVDNDGERNAVYRIEGAADLGGGRYLLDIGESTLIRSFVDKFDFSKGYVYDIAPGASFRIPLTRTVEQVKTSASIQGEQREGWYTGDAIVTLTAKGGLQGVQSTVYSLDGGASWHEYTAPIVLSESGVHPLLFRSTDMGGNVEPVKTVTVRIDRLAPVTAAHVEAAAGNGGWHKSAATVTLEAADAHSGVAETVYALTVTASTYGQQGHEFQPNSGPFVLDEGIYRVDYRSADIAGNTEPVQSLDVKVDRTAPTFALFLNGTPAESGISAEDSQPVVLTVQAADGMSGVAEKTVLVDGAAYEEGTELRWAGQLGAHAVQVTVRDAAGNEASASFEIQVTTSPASVLALIAAYEQSGDLGHSMAAPLANMMTQAQFHYSSGRTSQALLFLDTFLQHLDISGQQDNISDAAKQALQADALELKRLWGGQ